MYQSSKQASTSWVCECWPGPREMIHPLCESNAQHWAGGLHDEETSPHTRADRSKLAEADKLLGEGKTIEEVCRHLEITESTFHRWRTNTAA